MTDQYKNVMIALFVLAASAIAAFILLFIHPDVGDDRKLLRVRFSDIDKVSIGTRVTYGGKPVGEVVEIREIENEKRPRQSLNGQVYLYELDLRVDSSVEVFNSDEVSLRTSGLLGEKSVAILPMPAKPGQRLQNIDNQIIYGTQVGSVEQTFKELKEVADKFDQLLDNLNRAVEDLHSDGTFKGIARTANNLADVTTALNRPEEIGDIIASVHTIVCEAEKSWPHLKRTLQNSEEASDNIRDITYALNKPQELEQVVDDITQLCSDAVVSWERDIDPSLRDIAQVSANAKSITAAVNQPEKLENIVANTETFTTELATSSPRIHQLIINVDEAAQGTNGVVQRVAQGEGTLGKLLVGDETYLQVKALLTKAEVVANDVNHYGLLFHLDKGWQRLRARRLNLLQKLRLPVEFRNFFNDEIDLITTSLERVEMILEKNSQLCPFGILLDDNEFAQVYAELLRRVEGMGEALKLYNLQLVDLENSCRQVPVCMQEQR